MQYEKGRADLRQLSDKDGLFLTLCRFRHNFKLKDLAARFRMSVQSVSCVVNAWTERMYYKFGQLNIWLHRDIIINQMPKKYKADFPTSLVIIDGTELRTQSPCALALQSQLYSDYKSSTTLKCLIGCDPRGSLLFVSELFTGCISDKQLTEQSGFYDLLRTLKSIGYIQDNDAIMADNGFTFQTEIENLGLSLNLPPFASAGKQMSVADSKMTSKIAKHRVHIERLIKKVKTYCIVSDKIPTSLFHTINQIWTVCCYLTLFLLNEEEESLFMTLRTFDSFCSSWSNFVTLNTYILLTVVTAYGLSQLGLISITICGLFLLLKCIPFQEG